jgi:hypothetical protein
LTLSAFEIGKLKIAAHLREELDRAGIAAESIRCKSGGTHTHSETARIMVTVAGTVSSMDLPAKAVEDCVPLVTGETWHLIDAFIKEIGRTAPPRPREEDYAP